MFRSNLRHCALLFAWATFLHGNALAADAGTYRFTPVAPDSTAHGAVQAADSSPQGRTAMTGRTSAGADLSLRTLELDLGSYAPELAAHYRESATADLLAGRHETAQEALAKAAHNERVQSGLYTPEQFDIVALQVAGHLAQREYLQAFERQEYLLFLKRRHHGASAMESVPVRAALGDLYFDAFRKLVYGREEQARLVPAYGPQSLYLQADELSRHQLAYLWLHHAQEQYRAAITTVLQHAAYEHPQLEALEQKLIQSLLLQAFERRVALDADNFLRVQDRQLRDTLRMDERDHQQPRYRAGITAHERIVAYRKVTRGSDPVAVAQAMLALGDWHLLFGHTRRAETEYARARNWLRDAGLDAAQAAEILQPQQPWQIPAFEGLYGDINDGETAGHVDVEFSIGKSGRVSKIAITDGPDGMDAALQRMLEQHLKRAPFRPGLAADGKLDKEQRVHMRYQIARI